MNAGGTLPRKGYRPGMVKCRIDNVAIEMRLDESLVVIMWKRSARNGRSGFHAE